MNLLLPKRFCDRDGSSEPARKRVVSLQSLCLKTIEKNKDFFETFASLSSSSLQLLFEYFQERFALDRDALKKFYSPKLMFLRMKERFVDAEMFSESITCLPHLTALEIWDIDISGDVLERSVKKLSALKSLSLRNVQCFDDDVAARVLSEDFCQRLELLMLMGLTSLTDNGMKTFSKHCSKLTCFVVEDNEGISSKTFEAICETAGTLLQTLYCNSCDISDKVLQSIAKHNEFLEKLQVHDGNITDKGAIPFLKKCNVVELDLSLTGISCDALLSLSKNVLEKEEGHPLKRLDLSFLYNVTKDAVEELICNCSNLESLSLMDNDEIDDESLELFSSCCLKLKELNLAQCPNITDEGVSQVLSNFEKLEYLNLTDCKGVTIRFKQFMMDRVIELNVVF